MFDRRKLGTILAGTALAGLAGCTFGSGNGVVSGTLNVAKVKAYFTAASNSVSLLLAIPPISLALGVAGVAAVQAVNATLSAAMAAFSAAAGNSLTVSLSTSSIASAVSSGLAAMQSLQTQFQAVIAKLVPSAITSQVTITIQSLATVVSLAQALLPSAPGSVSAAPLPMTESAALANLGVR